MTQMMIVEKLEQQKAAAESGQGSSLAALNEEKMNVAELEAQAGEHLQLQKNIAQKLAAKVAEVAALEAAMQGSGEQGAALAHAIEAEAAANAAAAAKEQELEAATAASTAQGQELEALQVKTPTIKSDIYIKGSPL